jgi:hypothetical protein
MYEKLGSFEKFIHYPFSASGTHIVHIKNIFLAFCLSFRIYLGSEKIT